MQSETKDIIINNLDQLEYLPSTYESRLLGTLIISISPLTAQELVKQLDIPDSKVYPALNTLEELNLISVDYSKRPKRFYFDNPENLSTYLKENFSQEQSHKENLIDRIARISRQYWDPDELQLGNIARILRGKDMRREFARQIKLAKEHLFIFLSTEFEHLYDILIQYLPEVITEQFRMELVLPNTQKANLLIEKIEQKQQGKIKMKTSIWNQNSYIIRDNMVMINIFHSDEDVALLTNDQLLVKNVKNCWTDPDCCTTTSLTELLLPDEFKFSNIQLA